MLPLDLPWTFAQLVYKSILRGCWLHLIFSPVVAVAWWAQAYVKHIDKLWGKPKEPEPPMMSGWLELMRKVEEESAT
jgi:hypothetical protein